MPGHSNAMKINSQLPVFKTSWSSYVPVITPDHHRNDRIVGEVLLPPLKVLLMLQYFGFPILFVLFCLFNETGQHKGLIFWVGGFWPSVSQRPCSEPLSPLPCKAWTLTSFCPGGKLWCLVSWLCPHGCAYSLLSSKTDKGPSSVLASFHRAVRTHGQERHTLSGLLSVHKWNPHTMEGYFLTNNLSLMSNDTCFVGHCPDSILWSELPLTIICFPTQWNLSYRDGKFY